MQLPSIPSLLLLLASRAFAKDGGSKIKISVGKGGVTYSPESVTAAVGDIVEFHFYTGTHNVVEGDWATPCARGGAKTGFYSRFQRVTTQEGSTVFRITVNNTQPIWYYCSQGLHCQAGMSGVINPPASGNTLAAYRAIGKNTGSSETPATIQGGVLVPDDDVNDPGQSSTPAGTATTVKSSTKTEDRTGTTPATKTEDRSTTPVTKTEDRTGTTPVSRTEDRTGTKTEDRTGTKTDDKTGTKTTKTEDKTGTKTEDRTSTATEEDKSKTTTKVEDRTTPVSTSAASSVAVSNVAATTVATIASGTTTRPSSTSATATGATGAANSANLGKWEVIVGAGVAVGGVFALL